MRPLWKTTQIDRVPESGFASRNPLILTVYLYVRVS